VNIREHLLSLGKPVGSYAPTNRLPVQHDELGPGWDLGPAPASYSTSHRVVRFDRTGLTWRVPESALTPRHLTKGEHDAHPDRTRDDTG
jgi:hypothetical protein